MRTRAPILGTRIRISGIGLALLMLAAILVGGVLGYMVIEGWSFWDACYMTVITVTTVGYREIHPMSRVGEVFTSVLLLVGVGTAFYTFTLAATIVVEGGLQKRFRRRRVERMIDDLEQHFIVCGYGRIGAVIADEFTQQQIPFVLVERDPERVQEALERGMMAVEADASHEDTLRKLHIERARGLVAAVGTDAENVYAVLSARVMRPDLFIVGRAETEDATMKLKRAGADRVLSPYQIGAVQMAQTALRPAVVDFFELATSADNLELAMEEITIARTSALADQSILSANLRQRYGVIVVGIQREDRRMEFNPEPDTLIRPGDKLVVLGRPESLKKLEAHAAEAKS